MVVSRASKLVIRTRPGSLPFHGRALMWNEYAYGNFICEEYESTTAPSSENKTQIPKFSDRVKTKKRWRTEMLL